MRFPFYPNSCHRQWRYAPSLSLRLLSHISTPLLLRVCGGFGGALSLTGRVSSYGGIMGWVKFGQPFGPQVGRHHRAEAQVASRVLVGEPRGRRTGAERAQRGRPGEPGPLGPPGQGGGRRGPGLCGKRSAAGPRTAARERYGLPLARPPVGGAALSPQPPPQPPSGPPRVPGGASAAAAGSSMRTEPGPGHGDPQHHGPGQSSCPFPLPPSRSRRCRHASPGMCGLGWARAPGFRGSCPTPRSPQSSRRPWGPGDPRDNAGTPFSQDPRAEPL